VKPLLFSAALFVAGIVLLRLLVETPPGGATSLAWRGILGGLAGGFVGMCVFVVVFSLYVIGAVFPYFVLAPLWGGTAAAFLAVLARRSRPEMLDDGDTRLFGAAIICALMGVLLAAALMLLMDGPPDFISPVWMGFLSGLGAGALGAHALPPGIGERERADAA
jgi:hypothetical protein